MNSLVIHSIKERLIQILGDVGATDLIGGPDVLEEGLRDLGIGLTQLAVDLCAAEAQSVPLKLAVFDDRFPHAVRAHGLVCDVFDMHLPEEVIPWAQQMLALGPAPDAPTLRRALVRWALRGEDPLIRAVAQWVVFEGMCLNQRVLLRAAGVYLETMGARPHEVETIAQMELEAACALDEGGCDLAGLEDPMDMLNIFALTSLTEHIEDLRDELRQVSQDVREQLDRRVEIMAIYERLSPDDAVILRNEAELDGERLAAHELRQRHPLVLAGLSDDGVYKRVERLPAKARKLVAEPATATRGQSFVDLLLAHTREAS